MVEENITEVEVVEDNGKPSASDVLNKLQDKLQDAESRLTEIGALGIVDDIVEAAGVVKSVQSEVIKAKKAASAGFVKETSDTLKGILDNYLTAVTYQETVGERLHTVIWTQDEDGMTTIMLNPARRKASISPAGGGSRKSRSGNTVTRTVDGVFESMTVKEMVQEYADDTMRGQSLFAKNAWSTLFDKLNSKLDGEDNWAEDIAVAEAS